MAFHPQLHNPANPAAQSRGLNPHGLDTGGFNPRIVGYLGRALSLEFSAAQHYLAQAALALRRGEDEFDHGFRLLAQEEFEHANRLVAHMVMLGVLPNASQLAPAQASFDLVAALASCQAREAQLVALYADAADYSSRLGSAGDRTLFVNLLDEERAQLARVEGWLQAYQRLESRRRWPAGNPLTGPGYAVGDAPLARGGAA